MKLKRTRITLPQTFIGLRAFCAAKPESCVKLFGAVFSLSDMPPSICLLDLPNELVLIISGYLEDEIDENSVLPLAMTCKRMNSLLLPSIFTRFDLAFPSAFSGFLPSLSITGRTLKLPSAIGIASFVHEIDVLQCSFTGYWRRKTKSVELVFSDVLLAARALNSLTPRLTHLGRLEINPYASVNSTAELCDWLQILAVFLNSATRRGDCRITVLGLPGEAYREDPRPFLHSFPKTLQHTRYAATVACLRDTR